MEERIKEIVRGGEKSRVVERRREERRGGERSRVVER